MKRSVTGFTIVELLIVIVVIAILATISIVAYTGVQARARDSMQIDKVSKIARALEFYKFDNNQYPPIEDGSSAETSCGSQTENWGHCDRMKQLADYLAPYMTIDPVSMSSSTSGNLGYYYNSSYTNGFQSYGLYVNLNGSGGQNDGGYYSNAYEVGTDPAYCMSKYTGTSARWGWSSARTRCIGGD